MYHKEIEAMPVGKLKELQLERIKWSIGHAYKNVKFYKDSFDQAGFHPDKVKSIDDLQHVPFLRKQDLRDNYPFGLFAIPLDKVVRVHSSSGTTGHATVVGYTKSDIDMWAEIAARSIACAGGAENDIIQVAFGYGLFTGGLGVHYGAERIGAMAIPVSGGNTERQLMLIKDFGTTIIACTPSYLLNILDYAERKMLDYDLKATSLKSGILGAEPWTRNMRDEIESKLGIDAYDLYGLSEVIGPGVSMECSEKSGLHIFEDNFYVEVIDPETGKVLPEGEQGEIVFTSLTKEASPVIRYRSQDITRIYRESCHCGRTLMKMDKVEGRTDDMLIIRGVNVFPLQIESLLIETEGIQPHYQIIVDRKGPLDDIEVMVEVDEKFFSDEIKVLEKLSHDIQQKIKNTLGLSAKITLVEPMKIARSEGKAIRVVDKRK